MLHRRFALLPLILIACGEAPTTVFDAGPPGTARDAGPSDSGVGTSSLAVGWTPESHGEGAPGDYATVFPEDRVNRIDVTIRPEDWAAMEMDIQDILNGGGTGLPEYFMMLLARLEMACAGSSNGDACQATVAGRAKNGQCSDLFGPNLTCDVGQIDAIPCEGLGEGDTCKELWTGGEGSCINPGDGQLFCIGGAFGNTDYAAADFWGGRKPMYVPCMLSMDGKTWPHVGIRYKGNNSLDQSRDFVKKPLRLKFDEFETMRPEIKDQRFFGFQHLSLANNVVDEPYLRQRTMVELLATAGVPSPAAAFYRVFVDHGDGATYWGLYTMTEIPDRPLLDRNFGNHKGNLYKPDGRGARFAEYVEVSYHKRNNVMEADFSDVQSFITALNGSVTDRASWRTNLEATFDMLGFVRFWAANQAIANWDTYGGFAHNYYLYGDTQAQGALKFIPWDFDLSLDGTGSGQVFLDPDQFAEFTVDGQPWPLLTAIARDPVYRMAYEDELGAFAAGAYSGELIEADIRAWHAMIRPYVIGPEGERPGIARAPSAQDFDFALQRLIDHIGERRRAVQSHLGQ